MKLKLPCKKHLFYSAIIICVLLIITVLFANIIFTKKLLNRIESQNTEEIEFEYATSVPMLASDALYQLHECGGKIGIFDAKSNILIDIIDVLVSTLPSADRQALKSGIDIFDFSELTKIIDDFTT